MKIFFVILFILVSNNLFSQESDSLHQKFDKQQLKPRAGLSIHGGLYAEVGISYHRYKVDFSHNSENTLFEAGFYGTYLSSEFLIKSDKTILGPKIGFEYSGIGSTLPFALGLEFILYSDLKVCNLIITPRIGIPLFYFDLSYGYSIITGNYLYKYLSNHRFSIIMNFNPLFWQKEREMLKKYHELTDN